MNARRCDRCGKFYLPDENKKNFDKFFVARVTGKHDERKNVKSYDLCETCNKDMFEFMAERGADND